jgi:hypothetical protein
MELDIWTADSVPDTQAVQVCCERDVQDLAVAVSVVRGMLDESFVLTAEVVQVCYEWGRQYLAGV